MFNFIVNIWTGGHINDRRKLRQSYRDHYAHVRTMAPQSKILEFRPGDGYEQLCGFLDKPVPKDEPYPHIKYHQDTHVCVVDCGWESGEKIWPGRRGTRSGCWCFVVLSPSDVAMAESRVTESNLVSRYYSIFVFG